MCLPVAVGLAAAGTALNVASQVGSYMSAKQAAKAQNAYKDQVAVDAGKDMELQHEQLSRQRVGEIAQIGQNIRQINMQSDDALGQADVSAAEGGISGNAANDIVDQIRRQTLNATEVQQSNADTINQNMPYQTLGLDAQRVNRMNSVERGKQPGILGLVVGIGSSLVKGGQQAMGFGAQNSASTLVKPKASSSSYGNLKVG